MLSLIGTGLRDGLDISVRGRQRIETANEVFVEGYTSLLRCSHEELEQQLGRPIGTLSRTDVEQGIEPVLSRAKDEDIVILIIGDPFAATTHADLYLRARRLGIAVETIHNASIMSAIGEVGLELYRFGRTVSIPFWEESFEPTSFLDGILENQSRGLHTLCLLDIKADQGRFMTVREALALLDAAAAKIGTEFSPSLVVGIARLGSEDRRIVAGTASVVAAADLGDPLHSLLIPGKLHAIEEEMLALWSTTEKE